MELSEIILGSLASAGKPLASAELIRRCGREEAAACGPAIRKLIRAGKLYSWSNRRFWLEDEMSVLEEEARKLIRDKPLWKSCLSGKLEKTGWGSPRSKRDAVFDRLKKSPGVHIWPRHASLQGDSLCLRQIDLPFYLGKLRKEYARLERKLIRAGASAEAIAGAVCGRSSAALALAAREGGARPDPGPAGEADDGAGEDLQRDLCEQLAFAWQESRSGETRRCLEQAMFNSGLRRFGNPGEEVEFDGLAHESSGLLLPGEKAIVEVPGWKLDRRGYSRVLIKAKVSS